jgi:hypothetical protein
LLCLVTTIVAPASALATVADRRALRS